MRDALPSRVRGQCIEVLLECSEFEKSENLKTVFNVQPLDAYAAGLPEADDARDRVLKTIDYLHDKYSDDESLLILFLRELKSINPGDSRLHEKLDKCISSIASGQCQEQINTDEEKMTTIPFVIAAMTQEEASGLISGEVFGLSGACNYSKEFQSIREMLKKHNIVNIERRYGEEREDWMPYLESQDSIRSIIHKACDTINDITSNKQINSASDKYVEPKFMSSEYFTNDDERNRLQKSEVVLIIDDLSFFHPALNKFLGDMIKNEKAAIFMLSTLSRRDLDRDFYNIIEDTIRNNIEGAYRRYCKELDPKCNLGVDDLRTFVRWLSIVLHEEARTISEINANPKSRKYFRSLSDEKTKTNTVGFITGTGKISGDRR